MNLLLLKLILTPTLIGLTSLAGRRWGHVVSGWLIAFPLTAGPIILFLALSHGAAFAADAAVGVLTGGFSVAAFIVVYARLALRWSWFPTLLVSSLAFFLMTLVLRFIHVPLLPLWLAVLAAYFVSLRILPGGPEPVTSDQLPGTWDIPLRMILATAFVVVITSLASDAGPHLAGLLAPYPLFTATLAAFAQHQSGASAVLGVLRGLLQGLFSYATFLFTLAALLIPLGIGPAFGAAILVVVLLQGISLWLLRRRVGKMPQ